MNHISIFSFFAWLQPTQLSRSHHTPNLQCPRPQHSGPLVLGHVRRRAPLFFGYLLFLQPHRRRFLPPSSCASVLPYVNDPIGTFSGIGTVGRGAAEIGVLWIVRVTARAVVNGLFLVIVGFFGLIGFVAGDDEGLEVLPAAGK